MKSIKNSKSCVDLKFWLWKILKIFENFENFGNSEISKFPIFEKFEKFRFFLKIFKIFEFFQKFQNQNFKSTQLFEFFMDFNFFIFLKRKLSPLELCKNGFARFLRINDGNFAGTVSCIPRTLTLFTLCFFASWLLRNF